MLKSLFVLATTQAQEGERMAKKKAAKKKAAKKKATKKKRPLGRLVADVEKRIAARKSARKKK